MDELIDIVDQNGNPTGKSELKSVIHKMGYYHNTVHIWFYTKDGNILLSQRSAKKTICPLLWDVSVAGHIDSGESIEHAALREIKEEIGIDVYINQLQKIGAFECFQKYDSGIEDNEFHHTFICELSVSISDLIPQEEEVEALKLISIQEFKSLIETIKNNNNHLIASNKLYYKIVLNSVMNALNDK